MDAFSTIILNNGVPIPHIGLGVFRAGNGRETRDAVLAALAAGYRHIDTARIYRNEADVGAAVRESGLARDRIFVTTKLWNDDHGYDAALRAFDRSLAELGLEYVDLYLIHWPVPAVRLQSWHAMETLLASGRCRAIGVSNFTVRHLEELLAHATVVPAVNQIELHPYLQQRDIVAYCRKAGIAIEAYSPLTKGLKLGDPKLVAIANALGRSPAQILVRWALEKGFIVLPKSANKKRIEENFGVFDFELGREGIEQLDGLEEDLHTAWNPNSVE